MRYGESERLHCPQDVDLQNKLHGSFLLRQGSCPNCGDPNELHLHRQVLPMHRFRFENQPIDHLAQQMLMLLKVRNQMHLRELNEASHPDLRLRQRVVGEKMETFHFREHATISDHDWTLKRPKHQNRNMNSRYPLRFRLLKCVFLHHERCPLSFRPPDSNI